MKIHEAAELALKELGKPVHLRDLRRHIEQRGYYRFGAASPETALGVQLSRRGLGIVIGGSVQDQRFYRAGPAIYGLIEWLSDDQRKSLQLDAVVTESANAAELDASLFLEAELQRWLYKNLDANGLEALGFGRLSLYAPDRQCDRYGKYDTGVVGEIDMLLINPERDLVVIELKRRAIDTTVGQMCRYFGFVKKELCPSGSRVHGLILAQEVSESLRYALGAVDSAICAREIALQVTLGDPFDVSEWQ